MALIRSTDDARPRPAASCLRAAVLAAGLVAVWRPAPELSAQAGATPQRIYGESPVVFFEHYPTWANASPDGHWAIYAGWTGVQIIDLETGRPAPDRLWPGLSATYAAAWGPKGAVMLYGERDSTIGWFAHENGHPIQLPLPRRSVPVWSPDGASVAFRVRNVSDTVYVGTPDKVRALFVGTGAVISLAWVPDGSALLVLTVQPRGSSTLVRADLPSGARHVVADKLDAPPLELSPVAVAPDGRRAFVGLASAGDPDLGVRNVPHADRQLGIYAIDLATGARTLIVPPPKGGGDAMAPSVGGGRHVWTVNRENISVVVLPSVGGNAEVVMQGGLVPSWRPDGRQIGFAYGDWRWADWALCWDGGAVDVDGRGRPVGPLRPVIAGAHEDFQPVWSPRGRWVAYHSHRPAKPVPFYDAPGRSDDIWLRAAGAPARDSSEIRLTDFGLESGSPSWSPDGTRLLFDSYDRSAGNNVPQAFVVTIDTVTGRPLGHARLPLPPEIRNVKSEAWSPVGERIAIDVDLGAGKHALWVVGSDGRGARKVTEFAMPTFTGLSWTRDGKAVVYPSLVDGRLQLFRIGVDGGAPRQLTHDDGNLFLPAVSPDGRLIAATRFVHTKEVWAMPVATP